MNALVIDLTHGGILISQELKRLGFSVYAYDIYNTLTTENKKQLKNDNIILIKDLDEFERLHPKNKNIKIITPVHSPISISEFDGYDYQLMNFHEANNLILKKWDLWRKSKGKIFVEVTGVKGKTSTVSLIKNILSKENKLLFLSSLGAYYIHDDYSLLKKNISISPTSLVETINLSKEKNFNDYDYILTECSLGVSKLSDISVLTNIIDNYSIGKNTSNAVNAKRQVFNSNITIIEYETLHNYYFEELKDEKNKINSFSIISKSANVTVKNIKYGLNITNIHIQYNNLKTLDNDIINGELIINTFAPGEYNVSNILAAVTTCLTLGIDKDTITSRLEVFEEIPGRTNKRNIGNSIILEEINPGLNVESIKKSIKMVEKIDNCAIIIGGKYGVTCEEINEDKLINYLKKKDRDIILVDELGENINKKLDYRLKYYKDYNEILDLLIMEDKNILFIYRSNYTDLEKR